MLIHESCYKITIFKNSRINPNYMLHRYKTTFGPSLQKSSLHVTFTSFPITFEHSLPVIDVNNDFTIFLVWANLYRMISAQDGGNLRFLQFVLRPCPGRKEAPIPSIRSSSPGRWETLISSIHSS